MPSKSVNDKIPPGFKLRHTLRGHEDAINGIAWSLDGRTLASGSDDKTIRLWDTETGNLRRTLEVKGRIKAVLSVAWSPDGRTLASGSDDKTIQLWDTETGQRTSILEGHTGSVLGVSFSSDGHLLASKSADKTVRLWRCNSREMVAILYEPTPGIFGGSTALASHPKAPVLATLGENDMVTRIWDLDLSVLLGEIPVSKSVQINFEVVAAPPSRTVHYANAKVVLVGDTGVGKTGLGLVLRVRPRSLRRIT